jgi:hypothetical protein
MIVSTVGNTTTIPQVSIINLAHQADIVAVVRIESGEIINGTDFPCGAKYKGKVLHSIKNSKQDQIIEFGYYFGEEIGTEYIVFLNKRQNVYEPVISTNSYSVKSRAQFDRQCSSKHPEYIIMHHGIGSQKLEYHGDSESNYAFLIPTKYLSLPKDTTFIEPKEKNGCYVWDDCKWVDKETVLKILKEQNFKLK